MAENSIREQIIENTITAIEDIPGIAHVARKKLGFDDMASISQAQMPYAAIAAGLPNGTLKRSNMKAGDVQKIISELVIEIIIYGVDNINPDSSISSLADDVWAKLYEDPQRGGLCISSEVKAEIETGIFDPYFVFSLNYIAQYVHTTQNI